MKSVRRKSLGVWATAIVAAEVFSPVLAQTAGPAPEAVGSPPPVAAGAANAPTVQPANTSGSDELGEVIVTAERTEQTVQKAPLTIQVVSGEQVAAAGLTDIAGLTRLTTGVQIGMGGDSSQIFIRGVGGFNFDTVSTPGVAFNVDGVYVARPEAVNGNFYDLARVEVLKGPQGTLYGRNANGGSINVITNDPKLNQTSLDLSVEAGNYGLWHETGAFNVPVGENAALRGAFNVVNRDGYLSSGADDDIEQSGRLKYKWQPSAAITLNLSADVTHLGGQGNDYVYKPQLPGASPYEAESAPAENIYMHTFPGGLGFLQGDVLNNAFQRSYLYNVSGQLDWRLGDFATLTILPAYRNADVNYETHNASEIHIDEHPREASNEIRLGNSTQALTWVTGAYYSYDAVPNGCTVVTTDTPLQAGYGCNSPSTSAYAVFGQTTYSIFDDFRLIVGGRYTEEQHRIHGESISGTGSLVEAYDTSKNFGGPSYKVGGEYDLTPQNMLFLTYSTGFKSGGLNKTIAPGNVYQPEYLHSLEFGARNRFFDNHLQLNFGAFYWRYTGIQTQAVDLDAAGNVNFLTFNAGNARLFGGNFDIVGRLTQADTLSFAGEYTDSRYDSFVFETPTAFFLPGSVGCNVSGTTSGSTPYTAVNCAGFQLAHTPDWTGTLAYDHAFRLPDASTVTFDTSFKFSSSYWLATDFTPSERQGGYTVVDANLTYRTSSGRYSLTAWGRNLTGRVYYTGGISSAFIPDLFNANISPPRTFGVRATMALGD